MKKLALVLIFVLLSPFVFTGCAADLLFPYEYDYGITIVLDSDTDFTAEINVVMPVNSTDSARELYEIMFNVVRNQFGESLIVPGANDFKYEVSESSDAIFCYVVVQDQPFIYGDVIQDDKFFTGKAVITYINPLTLESPLGQTVALLAIISRPAVESTSQGGFRVSMLTPAARRYKPENGEIVAYNASYYAKFMLNDISSSGMSQSFVIECGYMISWSWFLIALTTALVVIICILAFAKKDNGKLVDIKKPAVFQNYNPFQGYDGMPWNNNGNNNGSNSPFEGY